MKFEQTYHYKKLAPNKLVLPFGNYYLCKNFIVGEIHEGVHFEWDMAEQLIEELYKYYGEDFAIAYIANRINPYSIDPQNWEKIEKEYDFLVASAIVAYSDISYINASLEKKFSKISIKRCLSLNEAIGWIENLKEFN